MQMFYIRFHLLISKIFSIWIGAGARAVPELEPEPLQKVMASAPASEGPKRAAPASQHCLKDHLYIEVPCLVPTQSI